MILVLFQIIFYSFAIYGFLCVLIKIYDHIKIKNLFNSNDSIFKVVLIIKNQENIIEGVIRNMIISDFNRLISLSKGLTIIDFDSTDKSFEIITKLSKQHKFLNVSRLKRD